LLAGANGVTLGFAELGLGRVDAISLAQASIAAQLR
jgi:hypothetical protein